MTTPAGTVVYNALVVTSPVSASVTAGSGPIVETAGARREAVAILNAAKATAGTSPTLDAALYESDDQTTWSAVPNGAFTRVTDAADSLQAIALHPGERKKYLTAQLTIGGTSSPSFPVSMSLQYIAP